MTNNVISRMLMGKRCSENKDEAVNIRQMIQEMTELAGQVNISDFIWLFRNFDLQGFGRRSRDARQRYDNMIEEIIEEHHETRRRHKELNNGSRAVKDLLDILLEISEDEKSDFRMTKENIMGFVLDMFVGGTQSSALTVEWALSELIRHPDIMHKASREIDKMVGKERLVTESDIPTLPYLQAIVKETLRLHPTGPLIVRKSNKDCTVEGYQIQARTQVIINVWAIGRDPNYWENPLVFSPERFVCEEASGKNQVDLRGQHYEFLPFGSGRRGCPGAPLALRFVQTSLAALIQCFEWKTKDGEVDMEEGPGLNLMKAHPLHCIPVPRLNPMAFSSI